MRAIINTLVDELVRLKASGVKTVSVSDESLNALRRAIRKSSSPGPAAERAIAPKSLLGSPGAEPVTAPKFEPPKPITAVSSPPSPAARKLPPPAPFVLPEGEKAERWQWLLDRVLNDPVCKAQVRPGKRVVLGVGSLDTRIMFVGEAPGMDEEIKGEPFVGPAGQLLTKMISAMGLTRDQVYIGNIMNWRPQIPVGTDGIQRGNREPTEEEMQYCLPFLKAQISIVQPEILVALGATAAKGLLGHHAVRTLGEVRGRWHEYEGRPLMISYHPSYLLRKEAEGKISERKAKRAAWEDFLKVMEKAQMPISDKQRGFFL